MDRNALMDLLGYGRDFAQGASNAVASNVSGPVDALSWLLRKAGAGRVIGDAPVGGSEWMAKQGLTAQPRNALAGILGESAGLSGPMVLAAKAPQVANALNRVVENAARPSALNPELGAIVYHGSPHQFDAFDASKIGTGEGAQAYGHGLYLADSPGVAQSYQQKLSTGARAVPSWLSSHNMQEARAGAVGAGLSGPDLEAAMLVRNAVDNMPATRTELLSMIAKYGDPKIHRTTQESINKITAQLIPDETFGHLYKADLPDEKIARMLDWDKPLSQQSEHVFKALDSDPLIKRNRPSGDPSGAALMRALEDLGGVIDSGGRGMPGVAGYLRNKGIPGIRYLDGGSRGAGAGTSNYVVFPGEESALKILERNGQPVNALQNVVREPPAAYGASMSGNAPSAATAGQPTWAGFSTPEEYAAALARDAEHSARMQAAWRKSGLWERPAGYVPEKIGGEPKPWLYKRGPYGGFDTPEEFAAARLRQNGGQPGL